MLLKPEFIAGKLRTCFILKYFGKKSSKISLKLEVQFDCKGAGRRYPEK